MQEIKLNLGLSDDNDDHEIGHHESDGDADMGGGTSPTKSTIRRLDRKQSISFEDVGQSIYEVVQSGLRVGPGNTGKSAPKRVQLALTGMGITIFDKAKGTPITNLLYRSLVSFQIMYMLDMNCILTFFYHRKIGVWIGHGLVACSVYTWT